MATRAFILIETAVGKTREVVDALKRVDGIKSVDVVAGPYDIIAVIEAPDVVAIGDTVTGKMHTIPGIQRTISCLAMSHS